MRILSNSSFRKLAFRILKPAAAEGFPNSGQMEEIIQGRFSHVISECKLDAQAFWDFKSGCGYAESYTSYMGPELLNEKLLEHFVSIELLKPAEGQVWIDVGSDQSPFSQYMERRYGCAAY